MHQFPKMEGFLFRRKKSSMRSLIIALTIIVISVGGSLIYTNHLENTANEMMLKNNRITLNILNEKYNDAQVEIKSLKNFVKEKRAVLDAVGNHKELDDIEGYLAELLAFTHEGDKNQALSKCYKLEFLIESLPRNFKLKLENIL